MKRLCKFVVLLFLAGAIVAVGIWLKQQVSIDSCLDLGGRWDDVADVCEPAPRVEMLQP